MGYESVSATVTAPCSRFVRNPRELHQVEQLRAGEAPDNLIDPKRLTPLTRTSLKEAFRAVAKVQRGIGAKQGFTWR